jgi:hypothetical protein
LKVWRHEMIATVGSWGIAIAGLVWAIISYRLNNRSTLALERTKFIFEHLRYLDTESSMQTAKKILYGLVPDFTVETFLETEKGTPDQIANSMAVDNFLNLLARVAYAHFTLKTITVDDLDAFGYYFYTISKHRGLRIYCLEEGYEDVIDVIEKLKPKWDEAEAKNAPRIAVEKAALEEASQRSQETAVDRLTSR